MARPLQTVKAAFLDLGGTLCQGDPLVLWAEDRWRDGLMPDKAHDRLRALSEAYRTGENADVVARDATRVFAESLRGETWERVYASAQAAWEHELRRRIFPFSRPLVQALKARGFETWAVTGVAEPLASILAGEVGIRRVLATPLEVEDGVVRGVTDADFDGDWKAARAGGILADPRVDLTRSLAVGDSGADLSLMEKVGFAIAVHPKPDMREISRRRGYAVLEEELREPYASSMGAWLDAVLAKVTKSVAREEQ